MKLSTKILVILFPVVAGLFANGQSIVKNEETFFVRQDSVVKVSVNDYRGSLVWQKSEDGLHWATLSESRADSLLIVPDHDGYYRAAIVDGTCDTAYSDTIRIKAKVLDGQLELPAIVNTDHVIIHSIFDSAVPDGDHHFSINVESIVVAFDTLLQEAVYYGFPDVSEDDGYQLNAKETALYFCLLTLPNIRRPEYRPYIKEIKDLFYEFEEVKILEQAIDECVSQKGYLDIDHISGVLSSSIDSLLGKLEVNDFTFSSSDDQANTKSATASTSPTWNSSYHGPMRVANDPLPAWSDTYDSQTNTYELKRTFYNSSNAVVGVTTGKWDNDLVRGIRNDAYIGFIEPYFPPDMLTVDGNIENLKQLYAVLRGVRTHGFYQGLVQSDAYSKQQDFIFSLKENEKDVFIFENGYYDGLMKSINVTYLVLDFLLSQATWYSSGVEITDDLVNEFLQEMIDNPSIYFLNYPTLYAEGKFDVITEDILDRFSDFIKSYHWYFEIKEAVVTSVFKTVVKNIATTATKIYEYVRAIAKSSTGTIALFDPYNAVSIPVSFDDAAFPQQPSNPSPHAIILENLDKVHFAWNIQGINLGFKFNIYFSDDQQRILDLDSGCKIASNLNLTQYYLSGYFPSNKVYYWRVEVIAMDGKKTFGPLWYFKVGDQSQITSPNFEITPPSGTIYTDFYLDASKAMVYNNVSLGSKVRWDFDGDGQWDHPWSTSKVTTHRYDKTGTYTVRLEINGYFGYNMVFARTLVVADPLLPTVETSSISEIQTSSATSGGTVVSDGGAPLLSRGVCWNTSPNPSVLNDHTVNGSSMGSFTSTMTSLQPNTPYYVRAYATTSFGTGYGEEEIFTTIAALPQVATKAATNITENSATLHATLLSDGGSEILQRGFYWCEGDREPTASDTKEVVGGTLGSYSKELSGLQPGTIYSFKSFATNSAGTVTGDVFLFASNQSVTVPSVTTLAATDITKESAKLNGTVVSDGGATISERGFYYSPTITNPGPENGGTKVVVSGTTGNYNYGLTGLQSNTTYHFAAYATNSKGTATGQPQVFMTSSPDGPVFGTFTDNRDGKVYKTVEIGDQTWMAENLAYLPAVNLPTEGSFTEKFYYVNGYSGDDVAQAKLTNNYLVFGVLYNWEAAKDACPEGWHLPSSTEWNTLINYLIDNGYSINLYVAKSIASKEYWRTESVASGTPNYVPGVNPELNNASGFDGRPGGLRGTGYFTIPGAYADFWNSTQFANNNAGFSEITLSSGVIFVSYNRKDLGYSVRCVKD